MGGFEPPTYSFIRYLNFAKTLSTYMRIRLYLAHAALAVQRPLSVVRAKSSLIQFATVLAFAVAFNRNSGFAGGFPLPVGTTSRSTMELLYQLSYIGTRYRIL
jgi:hypothetical protein